MANAIPVELDVISIRHDHGYAEQSTGTTGDAKQDLDTTAVCRNKNSRNSGADPGEVKWVNFHPPFSEPLLSFFIFLSLKY